MNTLAARPPDFHPAISLSRLFVRPLSKYHEEFKAALGAIAGGSPVWQAMKMRLIHEALALVEVCPRFRLIAIEPEAEFRMLFELHCPVPTMPVPDGPLVVCDRAMLGITYPEDAMRAPMPGTRFITILQPGNVWLANCAPGLGPLCLGTSIQAGTSLCSLVAMCFSALTLQSFEIDLESPAGVIQPAAALWWQKAVDRIPLTRAPFIANPEGSV